MPPKTYYCKFDGNKKLKYPSRWQVGFVKLDIIWIIVISN